MMENIDPLANIFNERSRKDINDFRNILEEAIDRMVTFLNGYFFLEFTFLKRLRSNIFYDFSMRTPRVYYGFRSSNSSRSWIT